MLNDKILERHEIFNCTQCKYSQGLITTRRELGDPRKLGLWVDDPYLRLTIEESYIKCARKVEVSEWRHQVYKRAWNNIQKWDQIRSEYEDGPCLFFESTQ